MFFFVSFNTKNIWICGRLLICAKLFRKIPLIKTKVKMKLFNFYETDQKMFLHLKNQIHKILLYIVIAMNLKSIILSERSQTQKIAHFMLPFIWKSREGKTIVAESSFLWLRMGRGIECKGTWMGKIFRETEVSFLFLRQECQCCGSYTTVYNCQNSSKFARKLVNFIACKFYHYRTGKNFSFYKKEIKNFLPKVNVIYYCS